MHNTNGNVSVTQKAPINFPNTNKTKVHQLIKFFAKFHIALYNKAIPTTEAFPFSQYHKAHFYSENTAAGHINMHA